MPELNTNFKEIEFKTAEFQELAELLVNKHDLIKYKVMKKLNQLIVSQAKIKCMMKTKPLKYNVNV